MIAALALVLTALGCSNNSNKENSGNQTPPAAEQNQNQNQPGEENSAEDQDQEAQEPQEIKGEPVKATGQYGGQIDSSTVEVIVDGEAKAFRLENIDTSALEALRAKDPVQLEYYELTIKSGDTETKQLMLTSITKSGTAAPAERAKEMTIEFTLEGMKESRKAVLADSSLGYYLYTMENFKLASEEPNRDLLYFTNDDEYSVRIEPIAAKDLNAQELRQNAEDELKELGTVNEMKGEQIFDPFFRNAEFFLHASDSKLSKNIVLIKMEGTYFKLTFNLKNGEAAEGVTPSFYAMLKTIKPMP